MEQLKNFFSFFSSNFLRWAPNHKEKNLVREHSSIQDHNTNCDAFNDVLRIQIFVTLVRNTEEWGGNRKCNKLPKPSVKTSPNHFQLLWVIGKLLEHEHKSILCSLRCAQIILQPFNLLDPHRCAFGALVLYAINRLLKRFNFGLYGW